jgi:hypothetical protein
MCAQAAAMAVDADDIDSLHVTTATELPLSPQAEVTHKCFWDLDRTKKVDEVLMYVFDG